MIKVSIFYLYIYMQVHDKMVNAKKVLSPYLSNIT